MTPTKLLGWLSIIGLCLVAGPAGRLCAADLPQTGSPMPAMTLQTPTAAGERDYLGLQQETFQLRDIPCRLLVFEVIGVYCPRCYQQAPLFTNLYKRIESGPLKGRVKMLGLAAGGTSMEIQYLREQGQYLFPILSDEDFAVHKMLGEPRTPFILLIDAAGQVRFAHSGVIEDVDGFYERIRELVKPES
jgi:peroxiredoxin